MSVWRVALYSALILTALWLLSPSRSQLAPEPGVIEITYMGPGGPVSGPMDDVVRAFEEECRLAHLQDPTKPLYRVVSGQNASRGQTEDPTRFLLGVAGGMPPDVIYFDRFAVSEWAARGTFEPLNQFLEKDDSIRAADFYKSCWDEVVYQGQVYGIPNKVDDRALFYNKDLLQRAGFSNPPKTWEELETMAVKLTEVDERTGAIKRLGFVPNYGNSWLYIYAWMNGGEFMSADGKTCTLNDPANVAALAWMTKVYDALGGVQAVNAFQSTFQGGDLDPFLQGKIAMKISGFWELTDTYAQYGRDVNWAVAPPPMPAAEVAKGRTTLSWNGGWCYAIPSTAKNKAGAWDLIKFLSSKRANEILCESQKLTTESQGRVFVPTQNSSRVINEWLFDKYILNNPRIDAKVAAGVKVFNELLPDARFRPVTPVGQLLWNQHIEATDNATYHKLSAQESLDRSTMIVQRELDKVLAPARGRPLGWTFFFWSYGVLLVVVVISVYAWDTNANVRNTVGRALGPFGRKLTKGSGNVEGVHSSYFRSQWRGGWLCASPWIIGFIVFTGGPILFSIIISFCDYDILNPARLVGFENYTWMFTKDPLFWKSLQNTVFMIIGVPVGMLASLGIAMLLCLKIRGVAVWRTFFYLPAIVPAVASSILWIWIFNPKAGLLNSLLASVGIAGPNWLQSEHTSKWSLILMGLWGAGGGMIIWIAGLKGISESYYEAASLDGANKWQQFRHVTIPLLSPYIFFNGIMGLIGTFQIFTQAFIMTQGGPVNSTMFYAYHLFNNAFRYLQMGYAAAMAWFLFLIVFGLTMIQMRVSERWVHYEEG